MSHRRAEKYFLWALPLIALRLLLPAGLMPVADVTGPTLELCSPDKAGRSTPENPRVPERGGSHGEGICPFAAAAVVAPASNIVLSVAFGIGPIVTAASADTPRIAQTGPPRTQRSRAPPTYS
jgi:hypothetical protein